MKKFNTAIINLQNHICGILFYSLEYSYYLNLPLILNKKLQKFLPRALEKYRLKESDFNIIYYDGLVFAEKLLILDITTFRFINNKFIAKQYFYNYGNDKNSLHINYQDKMNKLKLKNIITFGDKEIGCKVQYHYPLCLNFSIFKKKEDIACIDDSNDVFEEIKIGEVTTINGVKKGLRRNIKNFYCTFKKLKYEKKNVWERANRLIPECKFYDKEIEYINHDNYIDSSNLRLKRDWDFYDLNNFKSYDTNVSFKDFFNNYNDYFKGYK